MQGERANPRPSRMRTRDLVVLSLLALVSKDLTKQYKAGNIIKQVAAIVGGGGGGRPDMAQAGGTMPDKLDEALAAVAGIVEKG